MKNWTYAILCVLICLLGCEPQPRAHYQAWVEEELAKGVRHDSLFLGLRFGMTRDAFVDTCWRLNRQKVIWHGSRHLTVQHHLPDMEPTTQLNFYPEFTAEDRIYEMPMLINRETWAPWLASASADSLIPEVKAMLLDWYGGHDFEAFQIPDRPLTYLKIDGNRRIAVSREDEQHVKVVITDLSAAPPTDDSPYRLATHIQ